MLSHIRNKNVIAVPNQSCYHAPMSKVWNNEYNTWILQVAASNANIAGPYFHGVKEAVRLADHVMTPTILPTLLGKTNVRIWKDKEDCRYGIAKIFATETYFWYQIIPRNATHKEMGFTA